MAMLDALLELESDSVNVKTDGLYSESEIDWGVAAPDQGVGTKLKLRIVVTEAFTVGTSLSISIVHAATTVPTVLLFTFDVIETADLVLGAVFEYPWPEKHLQFTRLKYNVVGGPFTDGLIQANVVAGQ